MHSAAVLAGDPQQRPDEGRGDAEDSHWITDGERSHTIPPAVRTA